MHELYNYKSPAAILVFHHGEKFGDKSAMFRNEQKKNEGLRDVRTLNCVSLLEAMCGSLQDIGSV